MDILRKFETTSSFDAHSNECKKHLSLQLCGIQNQQSQKVQKLVITLQAAVARSDEPYQHHRRPSCRIQLQQCPAKALNTLQSQSSQLNVFQIFPSYPVLGHKPFFGPLITARLNECSSLMRTRLLRSFPKDYRCGHKKGTNRATEISFNPSCEKCCLEKAPRLTFSSTTALFPHFQADYSHISKTDVHS